MPLLEPLFIATAAPPAPNGQREAPADRLFRELLAPPPARDEVRPARETSDLPAPVEAAPTAPPTKSATSKPENDRDERQPDESPQTAAAGAAAPTVTDQEVERSNDDTAEAIEATGEPDENVTGAARKPAAKMKSTAIEPAATDENTATDAATPQVEDIGEEEAKSLSDVQARDAVANQSSRAVPADALGEAARVEDVAAAVVQREPSERSTGDERLAQRNEEQPNLTAKMENLPAADPFDSKAAIASDASTMPVERPTSKARESGKRSVKQLGEVDAGAERTATQKESAATLSSGVTVATPPTGAASGTMSMEAQAPAASDVATTPTEATAPQGAPAATASSERLGAMLTQRRVKATSSEHGPRLSEGQQARLVQRVARAFDTARMRGEAEIRLRLSPPELGSLKLEVRMESGAMTARLEVETVAAQQALADNLGTLRQRLAEQNIRVEQFDIDLLDRGGGNPSDSPTSQFSENQRQPPQRGTGRINDNARSLGAASAAHDTRAPAISGNTSFDVLI